MNIARPVVEAYPPAFLTVARCILAYALCTHEKRYAPMKTHTHEHMHVRTHIHTHMHTHTYKHIHTHTNTHIHTQTHACTCE